MSHLSTEIRNKRPLIWLFLCAGLTLLILWLALMPAVSAPAGLGWDKLNHAGAMAAVSTLAYGALQHRRRAAAEAFFYGTFLGVLIEILQGTMTTTRFAEWGDVGADVIGAGCAWCAIKIYQRIIAAKQ
jgi:VanZ family protein